MPNGNHLKVLKFNGDSNAPVTGLSLAGTFNISYPVESLTFGYTSGANYVRLKAIKMSFYNSYADDQYVLGSSYTKSEAIESVRNNTWDATTYTF